MNIINSQISRRFLDQLIRLKISHITIKHAQTQASSGRLL